MTEIKRLERMLQLAKIPFKAGQEYDTVYLAYPEEYTSDCVCYAWQHKDGLAAGENLLFISGLLTDEEREEDEYSKDLNAEDVFKRIKAHWEVVNNHEIGASAKNKIRCEKNGY